jgi:hypothetical protein
VAEIYLRCARGRSEATDGCFWCFPGLLGKSEVSEVCLRWMIHVLGEYKVAEAFSKILRYIREAFGELRFTLPVCGG